MSLIIALGTMARMMNTTCAVALDLPSKLATRLDLTASVYGVSADMLDKARIKRQQDAMLGDMNKGTAPTNAPEGLKTEERKKKSLVDKEITELNKAQAKD